MDYALGFLIGIALLCGLMLSRHWQHRKVFHADVRFRPHVTAQGDFMCFVLWSRRDSAD